jgi:hypothetical protein
LELPPCAAPRPGDVVSWYEQATLYQGELVAHTKDGRPYIRIPDPERMLAIPSFQHIRLANPAIRVGPNWLRLDSGAQILRPTAGEKKTFDRLLKQSTPPGPEYADLLQEIRLRGYEAFLVGGTVRDVLAKKASNDVDVATTMPLILLAPLVSRMYNISDRLAEEALRYGHLRLGGRPNSGDPFIDLSVFKYSLIGTADALFSSSFLHDVRHRDFACNAIYYDFSNNVLIDPTGRGVSDADESALTLIPGQTFATPAYYGKLVIRFFKFHARGFVPTPECQAEILARSDRSLAAMHRTQRFGYIKAQILGKSPREKHAEAIAALERSFGAVGADEAWARYIEPLREDLLH